MPRGAAAAVVLLLLAPHALGDANLANGEQTAKDSMITKIVEMLATEKDKIQEDLQAERKQMDEYLNFCHREQDDKNYAIRTANRKLDDLAALIEDHSAQITALDEEVVDLGTEMAKLVSQQKKEDERRKNSTAEFKQREYEQTVMVEELQGLEAALEQQMAAMTTPPPVDGSGETEVATEAFVQMQHNLVIQNPSNFWAQQEAEAQREVAASRQRRTVAKVEALTRAQAQTHAGAMLQALGTQGMSPDTIMHLRDTVARALSAMMQDPDEAPGGVPRSSGAFVQSVEEPASGNQVVAADHFDQVQKNNAANLEAFQGLKGKAEQALQRERDNEAENQHNYMLDKQARQQEINLNEDKTAEANEQRTQNQQERARAKKESGEIQITKDADMKYLSVLINECTAGSKAWDHRQEEAAAEKAAITKAMEILASRVKVFLQVVHKQPELPKEDSAELRSARIRQTLMNHFRSLGTQLHSLSMLNMVSAASVQPMDKVKSLIKALTEKLQKEAAAAASTHAWCEEENKKNKEAKKKNTDRLETLQLRIDQATAKKNELADSVTQLQEEIAEIDTADAEATEIRQKEHDNFQKSEADFKEAAAAVLDAIDALKDYYGEEVFLQVDTTTKSPIAFQAPDLGGAKKDFSGGILGMLDTMADEFSKTVSELQQQEREKKKAYDKMTNDNAVSKGAKQAEIKGAASEMQSLSVTAGQTSDDKVMVQDEMKALLDYIEKLKPTCVGTVVPYAERKAKREAEIEGLKQALTILEDTGATLSSVSFLQSRVRPHV